MIVSSLFYDLIVSLKRSMFQEVPCKEKGTLVLLTTNLVLLVVLVALWSGKGHRVQVSNG